MIKHNFLTILVALCATTALWAENTITYTATKKLTRSTLDVGETTFGSAIRSHYFSNGIGTITCSGEVTTIGEEAFSYCYGLTSVTIPNSVTTIGNSAFSSCSGLTSVTIPNSVTTIGNSAFAYCDGLTSVTIPNSVTTIGELAFYKCLGLTSIDVDAANTHYASVDGVLFNYAKDTLIQYPIGNLRTEYTIPNSVTTIGNDAFYYCKGLTSVTIPNSVTTIGNSAFCWCSGLTSVTIPNSVTSIGELAFYDCSGLTSIDVDVANTHYASIDGVLFNYAKDTLIQYPIGNLRTEYTIPNSVTTIGNDAFYNCSGLTSITIPNSVTTIGDRAFLLCSGLTSVTFLGNACQDAIGMMAFFGVGDPDPALLTLHGTWAKENQPDEDGNWYGGKFELREDPTALPTLFGANVDANKFLYNGQVIIRKDNKTYNTLGAEL